MPQFGAVTRGSADVFDYGHDPFRSNPLLWHFLKRFVLLRMRSTALRTQIDGHPARLPSQLFRRASRVRPGGSCGLAATVHPPKDAVTLARIHRILSHFRKGFQDRDR